METPNFYSTYHSMSASSSWTGAFLPVDLLVFGFPAARVRINNACSDRTFYGVGGPASTKGDFVAGCGEVVLEGARFGGLQLLTTTSSSTARPLVAVSAWASA